MNKVIGAYRNGNYNVVLLDDGTKIRFNNVEPQPGQSADDIFVAEFPESMDVCITHKCNMGCAMCYAGCTPEGKNGDILNAKWIDNLHPYTEMAIGGGNIFEHPDLDQFLNILKTKKVISNITVNQQHFVQHFDQIKAYCDAGLVKGVGVSIFKPTFDVLDLMNELPHCVAHCIVGVIDQKVLENMYDRDIRLLLLGYKTTGRGENYGFDHFKEIDEKMKSLEAILPELLNHFKVVSFDNLALSQLNVRNLLSEEEWNRFYMGDDGIAGKTTSATMYIDVPTNTFAVNSMSKNRYNICPTATVDDMFYILKQVATNSPERL